MLTLQNVSKSYDSLRAVDDVSFSVAPGQIVGLIGPNGSGKSTLLNAIAGTVALSGGSIQFDGHDITHETADVIFRRGLARSFQDPSLFFRMTVLDNTLLSAQHQKGENPLRAPWHRLWRRREDETTAEAGAILGQVQLDHLYANLASDLSGGQMKLLELGRSLMGAPKFMLLDEPTAGVAPALAYEIFEHIAGLRREQGMTFLIVEHRLEILFDYVDSVYVMHLGKLIAHGTPAEVIADAAVREIYFGE